MIRDKQQPDAAVGNKSATQTDTSTRKLGDQRAVASMTAMSRRWVDGGMAKGMPHLKLWPRRCRFDLEEVAEWLRQQYCVQRRKQVSPA